MSNQPLGVYEMLWDCQYCGTKKLLGKTHRHCPECGAAQDAERRYFPSDDEKVAVTDHVYYGADKHCASCGAANGARAKCCGQCGAPLDGSKEIGRRETQSTAEQGHFAAGSAKDAKLAQVGEPQPQTALDAQTAPASASLQSSSNKGLVVGIVAVVALLLAVLMVVFLWKKSVSVQTTGHSWQREIQVESFERHSETAWCDEMPSDAYRVSRSREVRSHRDVADGETCKRNRIDNGDGTFREERECQPKYRQEPVYDEHCRYTVDRWRRSRSLKLSGGSLDEKPAWPDASGLRRGSCFGCERESGRSETYTVHLREVTNGEAYTCDFSQPVWSGIAVGTKFKTQASVLVRRLDCSHLLDSPH